MKKESFNVLAFSLFIPSLQDDGMTNFLWSNWTINFVISAVISSSISTIIHYFGAVFFYTDWLSCATVISIISPCFLAQIGLLYWNWQPFDQFLLVRDAPFTVALQQCVEPSFQSASRMEMFSNGLIQWQLLMLPPWSLSFVSSREIWILIFSKILF